MQVMGKNGGLRRKVAVPNIVLLVIFAVAVEAMLFGGLISAYLINSLKAVQWPPAGQPRLPIEVTAVNTVILLVSAFTMIMAVKANENQDMRQKVKVWVASTFILGSLFVAIQGYEWVNLLNEGLSIKAGASVKIENPLPQYLESPVEIFNNVRFDPQKKQLSFVDKLKSIDSGKLAYFLSLSKDNNYRTSIIRLFENGKGKIRGVKVVEPLEKLESAVLLNQLKAKIAYSAQSKILRALGVLSKGEKEQLLAISNDKQFQRSIFSLFSMTQSNYGAYFYTLIGGHALHVILGLLALVFLLISIIKGKGTIELSPRIHATRIYWLFVVGLWPFLYYMVYLF